MAMRSSSHFEHTTYVHNMAIYEHTASLPSRLPQLAEFPVFGAAETEIIDMICQVTRCMRHFNQGCVKAFIDQALHCHPARTRPCRVARIGFRLRSEEHTSELQ